MLSYIIYIEEKHQGTENSPLRYSRMDDAKSEKEPSKATRFLLVSQVLIH